MTKRDEYLDCGCVSPGSLNEPGRHFCGRYNPPLPDPEPGMAATIADLDNDCGFMGTYAEHRAMGCCGPKLDSLAVLQRAARRAAGERDTAALDHCAHCLRPLPHTDVEARVCADGSGVATDA